MKYVLLTTFVFALGCAEQHSTPPPPPPPVTVVTVPPTQPAQPPTSQTSSKEEQKPEQQTDVTPTVPQEKEQTATLPQAPPATEVNPLIPIVPPPPPPKSEKPESQAEKPNTPPGVSDPFAESSSTNKISTETPPKETTSPEDKKTISGTPASDAAEKAAFQATKDVGVQPPGSRLVYTPLDEPRILYYKAFISGNLKADEVKNKLLADPSFNRSVWVIEDLRQQDKRNGTIGPDEDVKFQELGETLGQAAVDYNKKQDNLRTQQTVATVLVGAGLGAIAGRLYIKNEWIQAVQTKFGPRVPISFKASRYIAGGVAGGTTVWVGMETIHLIRLWAGIEQVYTADPLLDEATH